jgi:acyl carrier protein
MRSSERLRHSEQLERWLLALERNAPVDRIDPDADLIDGGIIDSLEFVNLLLFVEELRGRPIGSSEIRLESFRTLRRIADAYLDEEEPWSA